MHACICIINILCVLLTLAPLGFKYRVFWLHLLGDNKPIFTETNWETSSLGGLLRCQGGPTKTAAATRDPKGLGRNDMEKKDAKLSHGVHPDIFFWGFLILILWCVFCSVIFFGGWGGGKAPHSLNDVSAGPGCGNDSNDMNSSTRIIKM